MNVRRKRLNEIKYLARLIPRLYRNDMFRTLWILGFIDVYDGDPRVMRYRERRNAIKKLNDKYRLWKHEAPLSKVEWDPKEFE